MALSVDDILITRKNVFLLSGGRQYVADIESATNMADFEGDSIDVNPWNLYNDEGHIISNLFDSSEFNIRTQLLNADSSISPNNKNRHEMFMMPSPETYVANCQLGNVGYSISNTTTEKFHMPVEGGDGYDAGYGFCQYYYLSSIQSENTDFIEPDLIYTPNGGVQYISEYPLDKMYSDFGDNDLDIEDSAIDVPTIYGDSMLTKYFYDRTYSVNGKLNSSNGSDIIFRDMRTYYGMGYNGDTMYMVYRNDTTAHSTAYGRYRPHDKSGNVTKSYMLSTVGKIDGFAIITHATSGFIDYCAYVGKSLYSNFTSDKSAASGYYLVRSFHPKDMSFVLYAALTTASGSNNAALKRFDTLLYYPRVGNSANVKKYKLAYSTTGGTLENADEITFAEMDYSVIIGTTYNGSILVVSESYGYQDPNFTETNSVNNFTPFIGPLLAAYPTTVDIVGNSTMPTVGYTTDNSGKSEVFYNGSDILAIKKTDTVDSTTSCRMFLSRDIIGVDGTEYTKGRYFSAAWPCTANVPSTLSYDKIPTIQTDFKPVFDRCTADIRSISALSLVPNDTSRWSLDASTVYGGLNSVRIGGTAEGEKTYATMEIDGSFTLSFKLRINERNRHFVFTMYDSAHGDTAVKSINRTNNTWITVDYADTTDCKHTIEMAFIDYCNDVCKNDVAWISNIRITTSKGTVEPSDFTKTTYGAFNFGGIYDSSDESYVKSGNHVFVQYSDGCVNRCHVDDIFSDGVVTKTKPCGPSNGPNANRRLDDMRFVNGKSCIGELNSIVGGDKTTNTVKSYFEITPVLFGSYTCNSGGTFHKCNSYAVSPLSRRTSSITITEDSSHANYNIEFVDNDRKTEFISGYPIELCNGVTVRTYAPEGTMHNATAALVYFNGNQCTTQNDYFNDSTSVGGLYLQYQGITTDLIVKSVSKSVTIQNCPNGIVDCINHRPTTYTANSNNGYAYPHPSYGKFVTAGNGLGIFDGPLSQSMKVGDIMMLNSHLIVKNYSVNSHAKDKGSVSDKTFPIAASQYISGGYVAADMTQNGTASNSDELYTTVSVFNHKTNGGFESLSRRVPSKPIEFYPAAITGTEWKPYYAGKIVDFIRYGNGYYYIALHDADTNYDIIETDTLYVEQPLVPLAGARRVSNVRFVNEDTVVEYSIGEKAYALMHGKSGTMSNKRLFVDEDTVGTVSFTPSKVKMFGYDTNVRMVYGDRFRSAVFGTAANSMSSTTVIDSDVHTGSAVITGSLMTMSTVNNGNGIVLYNNVSDDYTCGSVIDTTDGSMPLSGAHNVFGKHILLTDDCAPQFDDSYGNGVIVKRNNSEIEYGMISTNSNGTISEYIPMNSGCYTYVGEFSNTAVGAYCCVFNRSNGKAYISTDYTIGGISYYCGNIFVEISGEYDNVVKFNDYCETLDDNKNFLLMHKPVGDETSGYYRNFEPSWAKGSNNLPTASVGVCSTKFLNGSSEFYRDDTIMFAEHVAGGTDGRTLYFGKTAVYELSSGVIRSVGSLGGTVVDIIHPSTQSQSYSGASVIINNGSVNSLMFIQHDSDGTISVAPCSTMSSYRKICAADGTVRSLVMYGNDNRIEKYVNFGSGGYDYSSGLTNSISKTFMASNNTEEFRLHDVDGNSTNYFGLLTVNKSNGTASTITLKLRDNGTAATWTSSTPNTKVIASSWAPYVTSIAISGDELYSITDIEADEFGDVKSYKLKFNENLIVNESKIYRCKVGGTDTFFNPNRWEERTVKICNSNSTSDYDKEDLVYDVDNGRYVVVWYNNTTPTQIRNLTNKVSEVTISEWSSDVNYDKYNIQPSTGTHTGRKEHARVSKHYIDIGKFTCAAYYNWSSTTPTISANGIEACMKNQPLSIFVPSDEIVLRKSDKWTYTYNVNHIGRNLKTTTEAAPNGTGVNATITFSYPYYYKTANAANFKSVGIGCNDATLTLKSSTVEVGANKLYKYATHKLTANGGVLPSNSVTKSLVISGATMDAISSICTSSGVSNIADSAYLTIINKVDVDGIYNSIRCDDGMVIANIAGYGMFAASADGGNTIKYRTHYPIANTIINSNSIGLKTAHIPITCSQQNTDISRFDNVESVYSVNRFTSQTMHKSNLFSIRIDDLGINDSPYLSDAQKGQMTQWVKNHVTDIVNAVKPAQTELFDVILG